MDESDPDPAAALSPPHWVINENDHGGYVIITSWILICYTILTVLVRLARKITIVSWGVDDYLISAATICCMIQSAILQKAIRSGLGRRQPLLSEEQFELYNIYNYIYQILFVLTIVLSKVSLSHFIKNLIPDPKTVTRYRILIFICATWGVASVFGLSFQCSLPYPWIVADGLCLNQRALYYSVAIVDILTDLGIILLPLVTLVNVQMRRKARLTVMAVFLVRITVCIAEAVRLGSIEKYFQATDRSFQIANVAIWTQVVTNLGIITACIPCLKPFLSSMRSGVFNTALPAGFESRLTYTLGPSPPDTNRDETLGRRLYGTEAQIVIDTRIEGRAMGAESRSRLTEETRIYKTTEFGIEEGSSIQATNSALPN